MRRDTDTQSEQMLWGKRHQGSRQLQGCHKPSICNKQTKSLQGAVNWSTHQKMKSACEASSHFKLKKIYLFLDVLGLCCCVGFCLALASRVTLWLQSMGVSMWWPLLWSTDSRVQLSYPLACGLFPGSGRKPVSPALAGGFLTPGPSGKPSF